jgi:hypothetical protein|tara:strand:- start:3685 stop:4323 length:639 start_codon:yes stop_codon:yes gene_type:complete
MELKIEDIMKSLQNRRKNGGCSAWRDIGLKWVSDNDRFDLLKYDWEWDYINNNYRKLNEDDKVKNLKIDIPDNPFEEEDDDELYADEDGFDDEDERLTDSDWEDIERELDTLKLKKKETPIEEYLTSNPQAIQKSFYCYIVSCMNDESIRGYMDGFRNLLVQLYIDMETKELPIEIKDDDVTMDFRKQEIEKQANHLSNQIVEELLLLMNSK